MTHRLRQPIQGRRLGESTKSSSAMATDITHRRSPQLNRHALARGLHGGQQGGQACIAHCLRHHESRPQS
ncbi:hypothetical protein B0T18DRAFT_417023 [Schizothecium vesticola]|uniref:Uncharacterized protein n=1 Tax=Schizothecium vesticola TaxID=314040 RepID=A0AA40EIU7_9PEZI|nr:hypothetical protein B0T18DRAFT_417023 [Schizothecium vesticola]